MRGLGLSWQQKNTSFGWGKKLNVGGGSFEDGANRHLKVANFIGNGATHNSTLK